ncbi:hypothetical protein SGRIM128S_03952 [Streptomyces griseomycini]
MREERRQGVTWYRTGFRLAVDPDVDASIGLTLEDDPERAYRVQIFLNGWNMGQYVNDVGPQHTVCRTASSAPGGPTPWRWRCCPTAPRPRARATSG